MLYQEIHGTRIAFTEAGGGPGAVLLHSSGATAQQWRALAEELRACRRVLAPDLFGYGESGHGPAEPSLTQEAGIVEALADRVSGPIDLIGHSYGGAVALRFALKLPERLRSLTLIEPVAFHLLQRGRIADRGAFAEVLALADAVRQGGEGMGRFVDYWNGPGAWDAVPEEKRASLAGLSPSVARNFAAIMAETVPLAEYRRVAVPTLLLGGARSPAPARRILGLLASVLPKVRHCTIGAAGHMAPLTHRDLVNSEILRHLGLDASPALRPQAA